jgi:molecular chaperone DnaJ
MENYYDILGVPENASQEEIKAAFRELAKKYHPDRGGDPEMFKKILEAYRVLSDPKLRQEYDQKRKFAYTFTDFGFNNFGFDDIFSHIQKTFLDDEWFESLWDDIDDIFLSRKKHFPKDVIKILQVDLEKLVKGTKEKIRFQRRVRCNACEGTGAEDKKFDTCSVCHGYGKIRNKRNLLLNILFEEVKDCDNCDGNGKVPSKKCSFCNGKGLISKEEEISLEIPAGFREREFRIPGLGNQDKRGNTGDLIIKLEIKVEPPFSLEGNKLIYHAKINFLDAILGGEIEIPFIDRKIKIKLPGYLLNGEIIKISQPDIKLFGFNDLYVKIHIIPPKKLTPRAKKLIDELKKEIE